MTGESPVVDTIRRMARSSAFSDPRFPPLRLDELDKIDIEISLLSEMTRITDVRCIVVGTHGLLVRRGTRSGVLLPQVAVAEGWNRERFLAFTCRKAGLPRDAWKYPDIAIYAFSAVLFSEKEYAQHGD